MRGAFEAAAGLSTLVNVELYPQTRSAAHRAGLTRCIAARSSIARVGVGIPSCRHQVKPLPTIRADAHTRNPERSTGTTVDSILPPGAQ